MNKKLATYIINNIKRKQTLSHRDEVICLYTLEGLLSAFFKTITILILAVLFNLFFEVLLLMLFYGILRSFAFGLHASKDVYCWISSILIYLISPLLISIIILPNFIFYALFFIFGTLLIIYSPADTPKRPLIRKDKRDRNKIISLVTVLIYFIISILTDIQIINNSILFAVVIQAICVNPIIYKIFNTTYNNYLFYKPNKGLN